ncbi:MAG: LLM class F420-dependent oxidoreductase [Deltaproteobacteria bacterium]|nr:LLM class F420-dependent oxidoreductase [Deltaproteobacteria bacterium]MBW2361343.1 LLM class F420-dependent oxidoreductase [Deltaproteobacteria bacterium]
MARVKRITFKTLPTATDWAPLVDMWLEAEKLEVLDGGWLFDHFYPIYGDPTGPCFEGWTALSYLAGRTSRLRLGLMVTGNPYRHPAVLANMAATFDVFSGGRLDLGLGAGWNEKEASAYGIPFAPLRDRLDQLEEACQVICSLLEQTRTTFRGKHYQLEDAYCEPKPIQQPRPPLTIGGQGERRTLRIAARFAEDWNFPGGTPEQFAHKLEVLHGHCAAVGRDPAEITPSTHVIATDDPAKTAADAVAFAEAGAEHLCLYFFDNSDPGLLVRTVDAVSSALA